MIRDQMNKSKLICLFAILMLVTIVETSSHLAFAATEKVTITQGSGANQSCVATANCFDSNNIQITVGDTVTWTNQDSVIHTVTSGSPSDTQTGTIFDSSVMTPDSTFSFTFNNIGTYNYFDMGYPWMTGKVIVVPSTTNADITVSTDKSSYNYGDTIVISGYVSPVIPNQMITYQLQLPTGDKSATSQVNPNADGSYTISASFANPNLSSGVYAVIVTYGGIQNQATFSYVGSQAQAPAIPSTTYIPSTTTPSIQYNIPYWVKNDAKWWGEGQISDAEFVKAIQYLVDSSILTPNQSMSEINQIQDQNQAIRQAASQTTNQINQLQQENNNLQTENENLKLQMQQYGNYVKSQLQQLNNTLMPQLQLLAAEASKPYTIISNDTVNWYFSDSQGNRYHWTYPMSGYDAIVTLNNIFPTIPTYNLQLPNGAIVTTYNYTEVAKILSEKREFNNVVDQIYDNAGSDEQFIYEVSYIVSEMTTYNKDITNHNLWPPEVLTRGEGDCKDKAILIADLLRSSSHTSNWKIDLVILDSDNPTNPQKVNHMIVYVDTGQQKYYVESTATPDINALNVWAGIAIYGWNIPYGNAQ
ncbi:MAG: hypothetical protein ACRDFB_07730 [Rhabdochlamydiaceae bacterium]